MLPFYRGTLNYTAGTGSFTLASCEVITWLYVPMHLTLSYLISAHFRLSCKTGIILPLHWTKNLDFVSVFLNTRDSFSLVIIKWRYYNYVLKQHNKIIPITVPAELKNEKNTWNKVWFSPENTFMTYEELPWTYSKDDKVWQSYGVTLLSLIWRWCSNWPFLSFVLLLWSSWHTR